MSDQHDDVFTQDVLTALAAAVARAEKAEAERDEATLRAEKAEVALSEVLRLVEERFGTLAKREVALGAVFGP